MRAFNLRALLKYSKVVAFPFRKRFPPHVPGIGVGVAVAEVVHVHAVLLQAARALLDSRQEASPVAPHLSFPVEPPGHRTAVCKRGFPSVSGGGDIHTRRSVTSRKVHAFTFGGFSVIETYQRVENGPICSSSSKLSGISGEEEEDGGLCASERLFTASYSHENSFFWGMKK